MLEEGTVYFDTEKLIEGRTVKLIYKSQLATPETNEIYVHYGFGLLWDNLQEAKLDKVDDGCYETEISLDCADSISFCFRDDKNNWDNNETKNYNEFLNLDLKLNITDIDKYILELSEILNTKAFDSNVIKDNFVGDTDIAVVSDISFYDKEKTKKQELLNIHEKLENSDGLEEAFTEVLANIIIMSRNDVTLDLGKYLEKIEQAPLDVVGIDEKKAAKLIKYAGKDILKWFMLSTYGDYYDDEFENIFGSDYLRVLKDFQKLYDAVINEETGYEMFARDLDCIIEDKMGKKK